MIKQINTKNIIYYADGTAAYASEKVQLFNCDMTQTNYGSVIIKRDKHPYINELYPSTIESIVHSKP